MKRIFCSLPNDVSAKLRAVRLRDGIPMTQVALNSITSAYDTEQDLMEVDIESMPLRDHLFFTIPEDEFNVITQWAKENEEAKSRTLARCIICWLEGYDIQNAQVEAKSSVTVNVLDEFVETLDEMCVTNKRSKGYYVREAVAAYARGEIQPNLTTTKLNNRARTSTTQVSVRLDEEAIVVMTRIMVEYEVTQGFAISQIFNEYLESVAGDEVW